MGHAAGREEALHTRNRPIDELVDEHEGARYEVLA